MRTIDISRLNNYKEFISCCTYLDANKEYPGWTGREKFIIATDLERDELEKRFPEITLVLSPYVMIRNCHMDVIKEYHRNERKYKMREYRNNSKFSYDSLTEECHPELVDWNCEERIVDALLLEEALTKLSDVQRRRITLYFYEGYSIPEIAESEKISKMSVDESIKTGLTKLKEMLQ